MIQKIVKLLEKIGADGWLLRETKESTAELFFVKKQLDMQRMKDITGWSLSVYRDAEKDGVKLRGSANVLISPDTDEAVLEKNILDAYESAQYAMNPWYPVYDAGHRDLVLMPSTLGEMTLPEAALLLSEALFAADRGEGAFLNSAEIFVSRKDVRILSSAGTDVGYVKYGCEGEFVVQCTEKEDVEQFFQFSYDGLDTEALTKKVAEALKTVRDRSFAERSPKGGTYDIVLSGEHVRTLLEFYTGRSEASMIYAHYSDWAVGKKVQGENVEGEKLTMRYVPEVPYSDEGIPMREQDFVTDGVLQCIAGPASFSYYLGIEPLGSFERVKLLNGTASFDEMKKGCLYPVSFSDFQMDDFSGHFGGEIRLAYLFTDDGVEILTGGSLNGSILDCQGNLVFSKETYAQADYEGPFAVKLCGVNVAGS